jgi:hypothetical protein
MTDSIALEAILDVGRETANNRTERLRGPRPQLFGATVAQVRFTASGRQPGAHRFLTLGVGRLFVDRQEIIAPRGIGAAIGKGTGMDVSGVTSIRAGAQLFMFRDYFSVRLTAGVGIRLL